MDVSDRNLQLQLTKQAKIPSTFHFAEGIFAFAGFASGLKGFGKYRSLSYITGIYFDA